MRLLVLTSEYPFGRGETFLTAETALWPVDGVDIVVVPTKRPGDARSLPAGVRLDIRVADYRTRRRKMLSLLLALGHPLLWREIKRLAIEGKLGARPAWDVVTVVGQTLLLRRALQRLVGDDHPVAVYSYWHSPPVYAAALLRGSGKVAAVVARAHRGDVYPETPGGPGLPLKRQLMDSIDHTWAISDDAARELVETYGARPERVSVARLGVGVPPAPGPDPELGVFHVMSVSTCTPLKQVPLICRAVADLAAAHPAVEVRWSHFGDGPEANEVRALLRERSEALPNLSGSVPGHVEHVELLRFLRTSAVDVLVNASLSEGIPVSIMEAMAHGIPAIAPAVGGVPELVDSECGWLLPSVVTVPLLVAGMDHALAERGDVTRRVASREVIRRHYDTSRNNAAFGQDLLRRLGRAEG